MKLWGFASMLGRRAFIVASVAGLVVASAQVGLAQAPDPAGQAPAAPAGQPPADQAPVPAPAPEKDDFQFSSDAAILLWQIKPDKTTDFELVFKTLKTKLSASVKPDLKTIGDTLKIFKVDALGAVAADAPVSYMVVIDPVVKTSTYNPVKLLFDPELFPREEAQPLFDKLAGAYSGINPLPLMMVH
jgi:hypothetical protein